MITTRDLAKYWYENTKLIECSLFFRNERRHSERRKNFKILRGSIFILLQCTRFRFCSALYVQFHKIIEWNSVNIDDVLLQEHSNHLQYVPYTYTFENWIDMIFYLMWQILLGQHFSWNRNVWYIKIWAADQSYIQILRRNLIARWIYWMHWITMHRSLKIWQVN